MSLRELSMPEALAYAGATVEIEYDDLKTLSEERAAHLGALIMDEHFPNWATKIDFTSFDIANPHTCVLGQVTGDFGLGLNTLRDNLAEGSHVRFINLYSTELGLNAFHTMGISHHEWNLTRLNRAWRSEIEARL